MTMPEGTFTPGEHVGAAVYDAAGARLGTVTEVDAEEDLLYLDPDPDPGEEFWVDLADEAAINLDNNWFMTPNYEVRDVAEVGEGVEFDEWPFAIGEEAIAEIEDGDIRLKY